MFGGLGKWLWRLHRDVLVFRTPLPDSGDGGDCPVTWFGRVVAGSPGGGAAPRANFKLQVAAEGAPRRPPTKDPGRNRPVCPPALPGTRLQRASWQAGAAVALMGPRQRRALVKGRCRHGPLGLSTQCGRTSRAPPLRSCSLAGRGHALAPSRHLGAASLRPGAHWFLPLAAHHVDWCTNPPRNN